MRSGNRTFWLLWIRWMSIPSISQDSRTNRRARWTINGFSAAKGFRLSVALAPSFCRMRCTAGESGFEALQPPRVRYPICGHGEALPPDQVAGDRAWNRVRLAAAGYPDGPQASARML